MPYENPVAPAPTSVDFGERLSEREHAIVVREIESADRFRVAYRAMVCVMEEQREIRFATQQPKLGHKLGFIPFMHDNRVAAIDEPREIVLRTVDPRTEFGVFAAERVEALRAMACEKIAQAPCTGRLIGANAMA